MNTPSKDQIAREAAEQIFKLHDGALIGYSQDIQAIIQAAIDKATDGYRVLYEKLSAAQPQPSGSGRTTPRGDMAIDLGMELGFKPNSDNAWVFDCIKSYLDNVASSFTGTFTVTATPRGEPIVIGSEDRCEKCGAALGWFEPRLCNKCRGATSSEPPKEECGEWTPDDVMRLWNFQTTTGTAYKRIADAHEAAIKAAYDDGYRNAAKIYKPARDDDRQEILELEQQLLAAQAAIAKLSQICTSRYCGNCDLGYQEDDCTCGNYLKDVDLSALREHDAEVRKPLVDLLEEVLAQTVNTPTYPDGPCLDKDLRDDIKVELASVKEGK
jgi:hypothetical protein